MADRTTSFAKDLESDAFNQSVIDQAKRLGLDFSKASDPAQEKEQTKMSDSSKQGSSMIEKDKPQANLRPPEDMANVVDKQKFDKEWAKEEKKADNYKDQLAEQLERLKKQEAQKSDRDQNKDGLSHS